MPAPQRNLVGQVYRCLVCGAEVSVIRRGEGPLAPRCCNRPMSLLPQRHTWFVCPVCGSEVMVIRGGPGDPKYPRESSAISSDTLAPRCCNRPMIARKAAA